MASTTVRNTPYPFGSSVSIYTRNGQPNLGLPTVPGATLMETATVASDGSLTPTALVEGGKYWAVGQDTTGAWRWIAFRVDQAVEGPPAGDHARLDDVAAVLVAAGGASQIEADRSALARIAVDPIPRGADPTGAADSTAALQASLNECLPSPNTALRTATGRWYPPAGLYRITAPLVVKNVIGFDMFGAGQWATRFLVRGSFDSVLELDGVPHCTFGHFGVTAIDNAGSGFSSANAVQQAVKVRYSGVAGAATRRVTLDHVYVADLHFVNALTIEIVDSTRQNDEIDLPGCVFDGGNVSPASPDATWWRAGLRIGATGAVSGNTFQILLHRLGVQQCRSGIDARGTSFHSYGGGFQACSFDINLNGSMWLNAIIEGLRSEQAQRLLTNEVGNSGTPGSCVLRNIWWAASGLPTDGQFVQFKQAGTLDMENVHLTSWPGVGTAPWVSIGTGALGHVIARLKGCKAPTAPGSFVDTLTAERHYVLEDYIQTNNGGDDTVGMYPGRYYLPVAAADAANNTLFRDSADGKLKFKDNGGVVNALY